MSAEPGVDEGLRLVRAESEALLAELRALSPADWRHPSNCPPWDVALLVAHVSSGGEFFCSNIERGLAGVHTPALSREERAADAGRLAGAGPERIMATLVANTDQFEALVDRLDTAQLDTLAFHNHGLRPVRWFVFHRLAELIFHRWDVQASLGRAAVPDAAAVGYLLPTMLEVNLPVLYLRGARGRGRLRVVTREQPPRAWLIEADGESLTARPGGRRGRAGADARRWRSRPAVLRSGAAGHAARLRARHGRCRGRGVGAYPARQPIRGVAMPANGSAQHVQFYFDPICPWAWRTSLWIREVVKVRPIDVEWKFLSLDLANRAAGNPPKEGHLRSWKPLRAMALARRQGGDAAVDRLYLAVGRARHERGQLLDDEEMLAAALAEAELDGGLLGTALGDPTTEHEVKEEYAGIASTGGFGVPTLVVDGARPLFGPVIDAVPTGEAAGEMWDRVNWLMEHPNFLELKRARP